MLSVFQSTHQQFRKFIFLFGLVLASAGNLPANTTLQLGNSTGTEGSSIEVPLRLVTLDAVRGAQVDLYADPNVAEITQISGSDAGIEHIVDQEDLGEGRHRVVVYSISNDLLFSEALITLQVHLNTNIGENDRSVIVESAQLADDGANLVRSTLVPNATYSGPDSSVVYKMGDEVSASSVAFGTKGEVDRVEFIVDGWTAATDSEPPYEGDFPLHYFGNVTILIGPQTSYQVK